MKLNFKHLYLWGIAAAACQGTVYGQDVPLVLLPEEEEVEVYVPDPPSEEDLRHYEMVAEADRKWSALFKDPNNPELHLDVAKHYNLLGNGDIALHELSRAEELGIPRSDLLADIGRAYFLRGRYDDIMSEVLLETVPLDHHGEVYLLHAQVQHISGNLQDAFVNFYQAEQFLLEDRFELNAPLAELYSAMGEYEKAELNVDKALGFKPKDPNLLMLKGDLVHRREGAEKSYQYYEWASFYRPDDIRAEEKLAGALYNLNKEDEMVAVLRSILAKDQRHPFANYLIAANFAEGNNIRTATRYLNQAGDAYDNFAPALLLKGKLGYATGSFAASEDALEKLIRLEPENIEARRILGAALLQQNKNREAVQVLDYIEEENRLEPADYLLLGNANILGGNYEKGTAFLSKVGGLNLDQISEGDRRQIADFEGGLNHGVKLDVAGLVNKNSSLKQTLILDYYEALRKEEYRQAFDNAAAIIDQDRASPIGYNLLGLVYVEQGLLDEARSNFRRAAQIDRDFHQATLNLAKIELMLGNRNAAMNYLNDVLSRDEAYVAAYELLHEIAREEGDQIAAERYLVTASNANPELLSIREKLLANYFEENNLAKARMTAERMLNAFPEHAAPYKALGKIELQNGNYAGASEHLERAVELEPRDADTYVLLTQALSQNNQIERTREILKAGLYHVKNKLPLQLALIELAKVDGNFRNSHLYVDQLKLDERTKARALLFEAELFLLQQKGADAIASFEGAAKAGASLQLVDEGLAQAREVMAKQILQNQPGPVEPQ